MCADDPGHAHPPQPDWRRAWDQSRVEPVPLEPIDRLEVTCLVDNSFDALLGDRGPARRPTFASFAERPARLTGVAVDAPVAEHGFSALLRVTAGARSHDVLFDTGLSPDGMVANMARLGLAPRDIGAVVLSHGHFDHTTGLDGLARAVGRPANLPIVLHPGAFDRRRLAVPGRDPWDLPTLSRRAVLDAGFELIEERTPSFLLDGCLLVTGEVDRTTRWEPGMPPSHERFAGDAWVPDRAVLDDQAVIVNVRDRGLVVLTGCGHAGFVNMTRYAMRLTGVDRVHAVIGGFHLNGRFWEPTIPLVIAELGAIAPDVLVPAHCTGAAAAAALAAAFPDAYITNSVGTRYELTAA